VGVWLVAGAVQWEVVAGQGKALGVWLVSDAMIGEVVEGLE
jgi:hypothetical protein